MGEIKFKTRLLLTNCSPWQSFFTAPAPTTPALPLTSQVQISPLFPSESPIDMEMNFSTPEERRTCPTAILLSTSERLLICIYTKARRDILEMLQFYPHFPTVLPVPSHRNHREGSGPCSCLTAVTDPGTFPWGPVWCDVLPSLGKCEQFCQWHRPLSVITQSPLSVKSWV